MPLTRQQCEHNSFGSSSEMPINQLPTSNDVVKSFFCHRNLDAENSLYSKSAK